MEIKRLQRTYNRMKVAEFRQRQRVGKSTVPSEADKIAAPDKREEGGYQTASALTKAVAKVKRSLPQSSSKKIQVVDKIYFSLHPPEKKPKIKATASG